MKRNLIITLACALMPTLSIGQNLTVNGSIFLGGYIANQNDVPLLNPQVGNNLGVGLYASDNNPTGGNNTAVGDYALQYNTSGSSNTAVGEAALLGNTTSSYNTAVGNFALVRNTGSYNTAVGYQAGYANTAGIYNAAFGYETLYTNTTGFENTVVGYQSLYSNTESAGNTAVGYKALYSANPTTIDANNTAIGNSALIGVTTGTNNTSLGAGAGGSMTVGNYNIYIGFSAGNSVTTGNNNIEIGHFGSATDNALIRIGTPGIQTETYIAGIHGVTVAGGASVVIDSNGHLGTMNSSARYKEDIHDMGKSSDRLMKLRPVTFRYKTAAQDGTKPLQYGLIAEEVQKVYPELIVYGQDGQVQSIQYQQLPALLLNEIQKEHRIITELTERVAALEAAQHKSAEAVTFSAH